MDLSTVTSSNTLEKLKCGTCQNYLSCFPVFIGTGNRSICGRCAEPKEETYFRNEVYEAIAQHVYFPCCYKGEGCLEKLQAKDMPNHENICPYRIVNCPTATFTTCDWKGSHPNLKQHCRNEHSTLILKNGQFEINFSESEKTDNLLECEELLLMVTRNFDATNSMLEYSVHQLEGEVGIGFKFYEISFECGGRTLSIDDYLYCFDERQMTEICLDVLKNNVDDVVYGKINLEMTSKHNVSLLTEKINHELLSQLLCSACGEYMMPPLNLCLENHTKCIDCRIKDQLTHNTLSSHKNFNLDKVAALLSYPCKYRKNGCGVISQPVQMKDHQKICPYGDHVCPISEYIKCEWNGFGKDVVAHVQKDHRNIILNSTEISEFITKCRGNNAFYYSPRPDSLEFVKCYVIRFSNNLFRLTFSQKDQRYWWTMHQIGTEDSQKQFRYEIEVVDRNKNDRKLLVRQLCSLVLTKRDQIFNNTDEYCYFQNEQVESLLNQNVITFKVHIIK